MFGDLKSGRKANFCHQNYVAILARPLGDASTGPRVVEKICQLLALPFAIQGAAATRNPILSLPLGTFPPAIIQLIYYRVLPPPPTYLCCVCSSRRYLICYCVLPHTLDITQLWCVGRKEDTAPWLQFHGYGSPFQLVASM